MSLASLTSDKPISQTRMNSSNLYATTTQIILKSDPRDPESWKDLYRLIPYLRNSLCCVVCSALLVEPLTPINAQCAHHLCSGCKGGRKKIKPQCENCKDCFEYKENRSLRILMQLYKKMCSNLINSKIFKCIKIQACQPGTGFESGASNLIQLIKEGAMFQDNNYESQGGIPKSTYSILPCIYTNSTQNTKIRSALYSVVSPGSGNKITIKRKPKESTNINLNNVSRGVPSGSAVHVTLNVNPLQGKGAANNVPKTKEATDKVIFKKPYIKLKKGCRCGNATPTPGKLTCCGQRCPCYVESKACISCKCRGCRNPHRPDGNKVMPFIPDLEVARQILKVQDIPLPPPQVFEQTPPVPVTPRTAPVLPIVEKSAIPVISLETLQVNTHSIPTQPFNPQFKGYKCKEENIQLDSHLFPTEHFNPQFKAYKCKEEDFERIPGCNNLSNLVFVADLWNDNM